MLILGGMFSGLAIAPGSSLVDVLDLLSRWQHRIDGADEHADGQMWAMPVVRGAPVHEIPDPFGQGPHFRLLFIRCAGQDQPVFPGQGLHLSRDLASETNVDDDEQVLDLGTGQPVQQLESAETGCSQSGLIGLL